MRESGAGRRAMTAAPERARARAHVEARAAARLHVTQLGQALVGLDHGVAGHPLVGGKATDRRQARARADDAVVDARLPPSHDAVDERLLARQGQ